MKKLFAIAASFFVFTYSQIALSQDIHGGGNIWTKQTLPAGSVQWTAPGFASKQVDARMLSNTLRLAGPAVEVSGAYNMGFQAGKAVINTKGVVTGLKVVSTMGAVLGGPAGVALTSLFLIPSVLDWLLQADLRPAADGSGLESGASGCDALVGSFVCGVSNGAVTRVFDFGNGQCMAYTPGDGCYANSPSVSESSWNPVLFPDYSQKLSGIPVTTALINSLLDAGYTFPLDEVHTSGPSSVSKPDVVSKTESTSSTGDSLTTTTTTKEKTDLTYQGDKVTGKTNATTTTNVYNNTTNTNVSNSTTVENKPDLPPKEEQEKEDFCAENPDAIACAETDTPEGEIPKTNKNITFTAQTPFGGGSCPADKFQVLSTGQTLKVVDWATPCGYIADYVRPVLILLGSWMAMMLLIPGRTES